MDCFQSPAIPVPERLEVKREPFEKFYKVDWSSNLGEGVSGRVRRCQHLATGKQYAVKMLPDNTESRCELACWMTCIPHPNIVNIADVFANEFARPTDYMKKKWLVVIMDCMEGGDLFFELQKRGRFSEQDAKSIAVQLLHAIAHLHMRGICHRDIKVENIFLEHRDGLKVRVGDFGFATGSRAVSCKHSNLNAAPEVLRSGQFQRLGVPARPYTYACDEWSLGVALYILLCGYAPFATRPGRDHCMTHALQTKILSGRFEFPAAEWGRVSVEAKSFIAELLCVEPARRLTSAGALVHPWLAAAAVAYSKDMRDAAAGHGAGDGEGEGAEVPAPALEVPFVLDLSSNALLAKRRMTRSRTGSPANSDASHSTASGGGSARESLTGSPLWAPSPPPVRADGGHGRDPALAGRVCALSLESLATPVCRSSDASADT